MNAVFEDDLAVEGGGVFAPCAVDDHPRYGEGSLYRMNLAELD